MKTKREIAGKYRQGSQWIVWSWNPSYAIITECSPRDYSSARALVSKLRNAWDEKAQDYIEEKLY